MKMEVIVHTPRLTEEERKKRMNYITEQMIVIAKRVEAKKQNRQKKSA